MKTFNLIRNLLANYKHIIPVFLLVLMSCNNQQEELPPTKILKAKPIQKIIEKPEPIITPPDSTHLNNKDTLQMSKDTTETMDQAPKRPATMPKKYFKLNIHKRAMITLNATEIALYRKDNIS